MTDKFGSHDDLNATNPLILEIDLDTLAVMVVNMNYGVVRLLAALVKARAKSSKVGKPDKLSEAITKLLNDGLW